MNLRPFFVLSLFTVCHTATASPIVNSPAGTVSFSSDTGAITAVTPKGAPSSVWQSGENGLWSAQFEDNTLLSASGFHATNTLFRFSWKNGPGKDTLTMTYTSAALVVQVIVRPRSDGIELIAEATPSSQALLRIDLPGRLRFPPASVTRLIFPHNGNTGLGAAFNRRFFEPQPVDRPSGWESVPCGPKGYQTLYGAPLVQRDVNEPAVALTVTDEGKRWLPSSVVTRVNATQVTVNRAPARTQADLVIADSAHGPYLSANRLGGTTGGGFGASAEASVKMTPRPR